MRFSYMNFIMICFNKCQGTPGEKKLALENTSCLLKSTN